VTNEGDWRMEKEGWGKRVHQRRRMTSGKVREWKSCSPIEPIGAMKSKKMENTATKEDDWGLQEQENGKFDHQWR